MDLDAIGPLIILVIWAVGGLLRMLFKARENRTEAHGGMLDLAEEEFPQPTRPRASAERPRPSHGGATGAKTQKIPGDQAMRPTASAPPAFPFDESTAAFGDTSLEFAEPALEGGLGPPVPSGGLAPSKVIAPPSSVDQKQRAAAPLQRPSPQAIASLSTRTRVRQLLRTRSGLADAILTAEVLGRPVSERE